MLSKYDVARQLRDSSMPEALADHVTEAYGHFTSANEAIEVSAKRLRKVTQDTLDQLEANVHIHDWVTSHAAALTEALADRARAINEVKAATHLLRELGFETLATWVREQAFGKDS